jgi:hypothetical protein
VNTPITVGDQLAVLAICIVVCVVAFLLRHPKPGSF